MQHLIVLRLVVGVISVLMLAAIVGVSWVRTEQATHTAKAGHPTKQSKAKHKAG